MNNHVHPIFADILNNFAAIPAQVSEAQALEVDMAVLRDKQNDGYFQRELAQAMRLQLNQRDY